MKKKQRLWFLTNKELLNYLGFKLGDIILSILCVYLTLQFISVQKNVQNGFVTQNWKAFIYLGISVAIITAISSVFQKWYTMKMNMYLRFNLFRRYRKIIQIYEKPVKLKANIIGDIFGCIDLAIGLGFNTFLVFKTSGMVQFNQQTIICAIILLVLAIIFGIMRGQKRASINQANNAIGAKEGDLTKFYTFSRSFLENALYVLRLETNSRIRDDVITGILGNLPAIVKQVMVAISIFGLVNVLAEGEVYSNAYIVMTAFTVILSIADGISSILENVFGCIKNSKDPNLQELNAFETKEKLTLAKANETVTANSYSVEISQEFTADVTTSDRTMHYHLAKPLHIKIGENILLIGQKGTGKTRFLQLLESLNEQKVMIYNDRTTVFSKFYDNFKSDIGWNYELIQTIAKGLKLHRLLLPEARLKKLDLRSINTGDMHLMAALIMLYYAISKPQNARVIIMDELLANVDKQNAEEILQFVINVCKKINSTIIFVGHSQQALIEQYCSLKWTMSSTDNTITIEEESI